MSEQSLIRHIFNQIDLYGLTFPLRYKKHNSYNTLCGITLSLITIFGMTGILLFFIIKTFERTEMSIISNTEHLYEKKLFNFTDNPFLAGYVNKYGRAVEIDPSYLKITLDKNDHYPEKNEKGIIDVRRESISIKLEYCKIGVHFNESDIKEMIKEFEYENYLCPVPGQNLSIGGRWGDSVHGYDMLEFHVVKCENTSESQNCKSNEEMEIFFQNSYFSIIYLAQSLDHFDSKNPIKKKFRSEIFLIVTQLVKRYYYYFLPGKYISDNGLLFSNIKTFDFFEYEREVIDFVDKEDQDFYSGATIAEVAFSSIDKYVTYERKYAKIQDSLGNIGGWIRIILTVCQFLSDYFSEKIFLVDIINTISNVNENPRQSIINCKNNKNERKLTNNYINSKRKTNFSTNSAKILFGGDKTENYDFSNLRIDHNKRDDDAKNTLNFSILDYCIPIFAMKKKPKFNFFIHYKDFIYKDISLEVLVPLVERLLLFNINNENSENKDEFLSKIRPSVIETVNARTKKIFKS